MGPYRVRSTGFSEKLFSIDLLMPSTPILSLVHSGLPLAALRDGVARDTFTFLSIKMGVD